MDVVAAVLIRNRRVLAACRVRPAGAWEFPGGKIEPGETAAQAIERECREELGVDVRALAHVATARDERVTLLAWQVELLDGAPTALTDHSEVRWLAAAELDSVAWLPIDTQLLDVVRTLIDEASP